MRIDISPDLKETVRRHDEKRGIMPRPEAPPTIPDKPASHSAIGDTNFQELFQSVYDGAIITTLAGQIVDANTRAVDFLQYTREEIITLNLIDVISGADAGTLSTLQAEIEKERFILIQAYCERKDKILFPAEIAVNRVKIRSTNYLCCFIRDISWRRQAEEMLRTVNKAIQNAATGIAIADLDGQIDYINQAGGQLLGERKPDVLIGKNLSDVITDHDAIVDMLRNVKKGENWTGEIIHHVAAEPLTHIQLAAAPNRDADEQMVGMVLSFLDVSDRIRAQEAETTAERQRVMMESLGAACHHLGQPATVLLASLELLARVKPSDVAMSNELLTSSIQAAESLREMLHNLNDITEYRTKSYIEAQSPAGIPESRILDVTRQT
jgi:PAS domain S-box-containing protein